MPTATQETYSEAELARAKLREGLIREHCGDDVIEFLRAMEPLFSDIMITGRPLAEVGYTSYKDRILRQPRNGLSNESIVTFCELQIEGALNGLLLRPSSERQLEAIRTLRKSEKPPPPTDRSTLRSRPVDRPMGAELGLYRAQDVLNVLAGKAAEGVGGFQPYSLPRQLRKGVYPGTMMMWQPITEGVALGVGFEPHGDSWLSEMTFLVSPGKKPHIILVSWLFGLNNNSLPWGDYADVLAWAERWISVMSALGDEFRRRAPIMDGRH